MAPLPPGLKKPSARTLRTARITGAIHPQTPSKTFRTNASTTDSFLDSKADKRLIRHSAFLSRVASSGRISKSGGTGGATKKRSRKPATAAAKQLSTLDSLADALPELQEGEGGAEILDGKIQHKSLKSKKGALKRKERIVRGEMERFGASMAQLAGTSAPPQQQRTIQRSTEEISAAAAPPTSNRWAALRGYISSTMEQNPAFTNQN